MHSQLIDSKRLMEISIYQTYPDGALKECQLDDAITIKTPLGKLVPLHEFSSHRHKPTPSVSLHPDGQLARIALQDQTVVKTSIGELPAELITFYPSGAIKRLFPLNGHLSGYWGEEEEYKLAKDLTIPLPWGNITAKLISIHFYENGSIRSLTFWPQDNLLIDTPIGKQWIRTGLSLYPDGKLQSIEPADIVEVSTPVGIFNAYDSSANGLNGDRNSLEFTQEGQIKSLITSDQKLSILTPDFQTLHFAPREGRDLEDGNLFFYPMKVELTDKAIRILGNEEIPFADHLFRVEPFAQAKGSCTDCSTCGQCSTAKAAS